MLHWKKVRVGLCAMILCFSLLPTTAFAAGNTLTLHTKHNGTTFGLYQIADDENHLLDQFSDSDLDVSDINYDLTKQLISYIRENQIAPDQEISSQGDQAVFMNLPSGVYVICGKSYLKGDVWYTPTPFTIDLDGSVEVNLKYDQSPDTSEPPSPEPPDTTPGKPTPQEPTPEEPTPQEPTPQGPEDGPDQGNETTPTNPNSPESNSQTESNTSDTPTRLPQTGQDWLTVLGTALSGSGLLLIGRKKKE